MSDDEALDASIEQALSAPELVEHLRKLDGKDRAAISRANGCRRRSKTT